MASVVRGKNLPTLKKPWLKENSGEKKRQYQLKHLSVEAKYTVT